jgi:hypothetical protein
MDGMMGLLGGKVPGSQVGLVEAVTGHGSVLEKFPGLFDERVTLGMGGVVAQPGKLFERLFLGGVKVFGNLHANADMEIPFAPAGKGGNALIAEAEDLIRGGAGRDFQVQLPVQAGDADLGPESELGKGDRHLTEEVIFLPLKDGMGADGENNVKVPGRPAPCAGLALAGGAETGAGIDPGRNF